MALTPPILDQRTHDHILKQLRLIAQERVLEWKGCPDLGTATSDSNSTPDAGMMLHRIFARLLEITLARLGNTPDQNFFDKNFYAFLSNLGIGYLPPRPAQGPLTFTLTSTGAPVFVPMGTRAGTTPSDPQQAPVDFQTSMDL